MRERWRMHQNWYFMPEDYVMQVKDSGPQETPEFWEAVTIPHTFRLEPYAHRGITTAQGIGTYVRYFPLDSVMKEKHLYLTFEAVMGVTDVWLNGVLLHTKLADKTPDEGGEIHTNYGGYLPFVVYLNDAAHFDGRENVLVVRTNNQDNGQVPPGKPQELLDFTYFGGIYRDVWLDAVEDIFVTDPLYEDVENGGGIVLEYPIVSKEKAVVSVKTQLRSMKKEEEQITLMQEIVDTDGNCAAQWQQQITLFPQNAQEVLGEIEVEKPQLWNTEHPYLYELVTSVWAGDVLKDQKKTRFGIRQIETNREQGIVINGEVQPFLSGINRHQDYPVIGNAAPASMQKRDAVLYKKAGFKVIRAAHYPMSEEFLNACDELGLLLFEATPGWQWYPTDEPEPFTSRVHNNIRQMVRRDRDHPCVLAYETVLNETYHIPYGYSRDSALTALAEQKSAKTAGESYGYDPSPEANGIDKVSDFIYGFQDPLEKTEKAVMFHREYTDCYIEHYGEFHSRRVTRGTADGFYPHGEARNLVKANQMLWRNLDEEYSLAGCYELHEKNPAFTGAAIWTGIDSRGFNGYMSPCGVWDGYRIPKISYWAYASQQEENPVLYLASEWTKTAPVMDKADEEVKIGTDKLREIYVYSNAGTVVLTVEKDGEILWEKTQKPYTREKAGYLPHPPFYFAEVPYSEGTVLRARGYDEKGNLWAQDLRKTAGKPHHIRVSADFLGIPLQSDGNDVVFLRAEILDENNILCTEAEPRVFFEVEGDAQIVGTGNLLAETNPARAEAGIASAYLRAGNTSGVIQVSASAKGLSGDSVEISIIPSVYPEFAGTRCVEEKLHSGKRANLSSRLLRGDVSVIPLAESDGERYPESILLKGSACWKLNGENYLRMGCKVRSGDREAQLLIYQDDILRWKGKADQEGMITLSLETSGVLRTELRAQTPAELLLLSPYLWKGETVEKATELSANLAFGKSASASDGAESAENLWKGGAWFGGQPKDGPQEWQVDLGEICSVRNVRVDVGCQMGSDCTLYRYEIHTSENGTDWEKQAENCRTSWSNGVLDYFTAEKVRYVKVIFISVDGRLSAGIRRFEIYRDYGVDDVREYALSGIAVEENDLVFSSESLEYTLFEQEKLTIRALAADPEAEVSICGTPVLQPENHQINAVQPVTVYRVDCGGEVKIEVRSASGKGVRTYRIHF